MAVVVKSNGIDPIVGLSVHHLCSSTLVGIGMFTGGHDLDFDPWPNRSSLLAPLASAVRATQPLPHPQIPRSPGRSAPAPQGGQDLQTGEDGGQVVPAIPGQGSKPKSHQLNIRVNPR